MILYIKPVANIVAFAINGQIFTREALNMIKGISSLENDKVHNCWNNW